MIDEQGAAASGKTDEPGETDFKIKKPKEYRKPCRLKKSIGNRSNCMEKVSGNQLLHRV